MASQIVDNPGDFKWKPKYERDADIDSASLSQTNGMGVSRHMILSSAMPMRWVLKFQCSHATYLEIRNFLTARQMGKIPFTWRDHNTNTLHTVIVDGGIKERTSSRNDTSQVPVSHEFTLTFVKYY